MATLTPPFLVACNYQVKRKHYISEKQKKIKKQTKQTSINFKNKINVIRTAPKPQNDFSKHIKTF